VFSVGQLTSGQSKFSYKNDFEKILAKTKSANDNLTFKKLLKRFNAKDTSLTDFEVLALLIGFTNQPAYQPYTDIDTERKIYHLNDEGKFQEALDMATIFLKNHPLSVKAIFEKVYSFNNLNQKDSSAFYFWKGKSIFKAMQSSGNGKSPEDPIFAMGPGDGQDYIRKYIGNQIGGAKIGMMGSASDQKGNFLDMLEVVPKDGSAPYILYFVIQHATNKMFTGDKKNKLEKALKELENSKKKN
jgi:hypothetical protein